MKTHLRALTALLLMAFAIDGALADPVIDDGVLELSLALRASKMAIRYSRQMAVRMDPEDRKLTAVYEQYFDDLSSTQINMTRLKGQTVYLMRSEVALPQRAYELLNEMAGIKTRMQVLEMDLKAVNADKDVADISMMFAARADVEKARQVTEEFLEILAPAMEAATK